MTEKFHRSIAVFAAVAALVIGVILALVLRLQKSPADPTTFHLNSEFYASSEITHTSIDDFSSLLDSNSSFLVFVSQPDCRAAADFRKVLESFLADHPLQILEVDFSSLKASGLAPSVKFYPSFLIYHDGELVDFLDADSDEDVDAFKTTEDFTNWLGSYVNFSK